MSVQRPTAPTLHIPLCRNLARALALAAIALISSGCQTVQTTEGGAIGVERKQHMLVSEQEVETASAQAYQQQLDQAKTAGKLNTDKAITSRVRAIAQRLIPQTATF